MQHEHATAGGTLQGGQEEEEEADSVKEVSWGVWSAVVITVAHLEVCPSDSVQSTQCT